MAGRIAPPPHLFLNALKTERSDGSRWVKSTAIQRRIGGTARGIQITADALVAMGRIERVWNATHWEYRVK